MAFCRVKSLFLCDFDKLAKLIAWQRAVRLGESHYHE